MTKSEKLKNLAMSLSVCFMANRNFENLKNGIKLNASHSKKLKNEAILEIANQIIAIKNHLELIKKESKISVASGKKQAKNYIQ